MRPRSSLLVAGIVWLLTVPLLAQDDPLRQAFKSPPDSARPRVWWHWMNGNISKEGIKLDLEWMHRVGIAGFQNFDAALPTPQVVDQRLAYMTPEWKDAFKYATTLADQLGMEMAIAGSPGWSETGGPWVPASQGMKKYVWSETLVGGRKTVRGHAGSSPEQHRRLSGHGRPRAVRPGRRCRPLRQFYADAAVVAFRVPPGESPGDSATAKITSSGEGLDAAMLDDGDLEKTTHVPIPAAGAASWIQYEYPSRRRRSAPSHT